MILKNVEIFIERCTEAGLVNTTESAADSAEEKEFNALALEVFAHQYEHVPLYRRLCELRGTEPAGIEHWSAIPAAPADLFKEDLGIAPVTAGAEFLSSGTTLGGNRRSRHQVSAASLDLYRRSSVAHFAAMAAADSPGQMAVLVLGPTARTHPSSSLGHMYSFIQDAFGDEGSTQSPDSDVLFDADGQLDVPLAVAALEAVAAGTSPVLILALSNTITAVFEALRNQKKFLRLPADSRLVDTGGSKGGRTFSRSGILKAAWRFLHIPAYLCIGEYGMTELLSQFYEDALYSRWSGNLRPRAKIGPAWTRTTVVDPTTLAPVASGERGLLKHFDLANCESVSAVQTLDLGITKGAGFEVLGRASDSELRGCSQLMSMVSGNEQR